MHAENEFEDALTNLWSFVCPCRFSSPSIVSDAEYQAKACLKLSNWLKQNYSDLRLDDLVLDMQSDFEMADSSSPGRGRPSSGDERLSSKPPLGPIIEEIVGTDTKLSTHLCSIL
ncbi:hypothetical protein L3X38_043709 [Prunus dulcis]|uniref:Uncharacterized protein n=1 Tax=Prunus dulcis TaxID=3755 RepID=A0AAD4UYA4_PRUDU|nr:hypothetical protein L3X38_043709 [Prunus dulcis]